MICGKSLESLGIHVDSDRVLKLQAVGVDSTTSVGLDEALASIVKTFSNLAGNYLTQLLKNTSEWFIKLVAKGKWPADVPPPISDEVHSRIQTAITVCIASPPSSEFPMRYEAMACLQVMAVTAGMRAPFSRRRGRNQTCPCRLSTNACGPSVHIISGCSN